jgi:hypothetical protein
MRDKFHKNYRFNVTDGSVSMRVHYFVDAYNLYTARWWDATISMWKADTKYTEREILELICKITLGDQ